MRYPSHVPGLSEPRPQLRRRARWELPARIALGTVVLFLAVQVLTFGYDFGYGEQTVLSLKGISWADDTALVNDWFNDSVPQPHVLFDVITWFGESIGALPEVYFLYWLASLAVVAAATTLLAERWLPGPLRNLELAVLVLLVAGPYFALGTFLVIHTQAVPNGLGGALGLLAAVLLVRRSWRAAAVVGLVTTLVHIQHGTVVAFLLLVAYVVSPDRRGVRWYPAVIAGLGAIVFTVSLQRGLFVGNSGFTEICERASTGHCNPDQWPEPVVRGGVLLLALGAAAPVLARRADRLSMALVLAPALLVWAGLASDLLDVPVLEDLSRRLFIYRFVMVVAPFAAWAVVVALTRVVDGRWGLAAAAGGLLALWWYVQLPFAALGRSQPSARSTLELGVVLGGAGAAVAAAVAWRLSSRPWSLRVPAALAVAAALPLPTLGLGLRELDQAPLSISYRADDTLPAVAADLAAAIPVGSVVAVPPDFTWFPLLTRRAVVATCKLIPYGGEPWEQYKQRMAALGVPGDYGRCSPEGFHALSIDELARLRGRFGATHVLLPTESAAYDEARRRWPVVHDSGGTTHWVVAEIPGGGGT